MLVRSEDSAALDIVPLDLLQSENLDEQRMAPSLPSVDV